MKMTTIIVFNIVILLIITCMILVSSVSPVRKRVVIDVDVGKDDGHALVLFLNADKEKIIKIEAIICTVGNSHVADTCINLLRILHTAGRLDIPVYKGAKTPLVQKYELPLWDGVDGFSDLNYTRFPDPNWIRNETPAEALHTLVNKYPNEISIILLGPTTNFAIPLIMYDDDDFASKIKDVYIMGGNYDHLNQGHEYIPMAEFNFAVDPEAVHIVFEHAKWSITMIPMEVCESTNITSDWRWKVLGAINSPLCNFIKRADMAVVEQKDNWIPYDAFLALAYLYPISTTIQLINATIELQNTDERGQMVVTSNNGGNVNVITGFDENQFMIIMKSACNNVCNLQQCNNYYK